LGSTAAGPRTPRIITRSKRSSARRRVLVPPWWQQAGRGGGADEDAGRALSAKLVKRAMERGCRCGRTRCLKQYCQCFRNDLRCGPECLCDNCYNDGKHETERGQAIRNIRVNHPTAFRGTALELEDQVVRSPGGTVKMVRGCRCKRSRCQKKYCECFGAGLKCSANCLCTSCRNGNEQMGAGVMPSILAELSRKAGGGGGGQQQQHTASHSSRHPTNNSRASSRTPVERAEMALMAGPRASQQQQQPSPSPLLMARTRPAVPSARHHTEARGAAAPPREAPKPRQPLSTDTVSDDGGGCAEDSEEFERLLAVELASATTPRFLHLPTDTTPRTGVTPLPRQLGWGDDSPSGSSMWRVGAVAVAPPSSAPSLLTSPPASLRGSLFAAVDGPAPPAAAAGYGAPPESFEAAAPLARMTSSRLHRDTPPCTPISGEELTAQPMSLGAAGGGVEGVRRGGGEGGEPARDDSAGPAPELGDAAAREELERGAGLCVTLASWFFE